MLRLMKIHLKWYQNHGDAGLLRGSISDAGRRKRSKVEHDTRILKMGKR